MGRPRILFALAFVVCWSTVLMGCFRPAPEVKDVSAVAAPEDENTQALRQRANEFGDLLLKLRTMTAEEGHYELQFFIVPSPRLREQVKNYYGDFSAKSEKYPILTHSVTDIAMKPSGTAADVTYAMIAQGPGGQEIPAEQVTRWKRLKGQWYRTISEPQTRLQ